MRYKISDSNILIEHAEEETEAIIAAVFGILVPRIAKKLYFLHHEKSDYPHLRLLQEANPLFRMVARNQDTPTVLKHFRIVENDAGLYIAPNARGKLDRALWAALCEEISERSRKSSAT